MLASRNFILFALLLLTLSSLGGCDMQNRLLYFPGSIAPSEAELKGRNLSLWQTSQGEYRGVVAANDSAGAKGTIVVFHGNAGIAADRSYYLNDLGALGYYVILAEYPAYGGRRGEVGEKTFVRDACETVRIAAERYPGPIFLLGESLGCGVAAAVAAKTKVKIRGILLITPWDTLASIAAEKFPFLPVRLFLTDKYDNIANLRSFRGRIAVVGAESDEVIPIRHARKLYDSLSKVSCRMWVVAGAGHNDWTMRVDSGWWKEIMEFISV
jgi:pimeloyl-ACP methyl ester carboxylesterase